MPVREKGEGVPVRNLRVPSHVPSHPQTAAKVRGFSPIASGFTAETDWLLEQAGFELSVPLGKMSFDFCGRVGPEHYDRGFRDRRPRRTSRNAEYSDLDVMPRR